MRAWRRATAVGNPASKVETECADGALPDISEASPARGFWLPGEAEVAELAEIAELPLGSAEACTGEV
jgi:hypothetical protein